MADSLRNAVEAILFLEDRLLTVHPAFSLRYVLVYGAIDTPVNPDIAHGMAGPGLTAAREALARKRRGRLRFQLDIPDHPYSEEMQMLFRLLELLSAHWKQKDYGLIKELLVNSSDMAVAALFEKTASQIWKRRKTLQIEEFTSVKELLMRTVDYCERDRHA